MPDVRPISDYADIIRIGINPSDFPSQLFAYYSIPDFDKSGQPSLAAGNSIESNKLVVASGDVLISKLNPRIRRVWLTRHAEDDIIGVASTEFVDLRPKEHCSPPYLYYLLQTDEVFAQFEANAVGTTNSHSRFPLALISKLKGNFPPLSAQRKIARILTTVDNLIERTEALIAKHQAVKQGLLHDLLTRGVDAQGRLRPPREEAPDLYKESPLGWIPLEWEVAPLKALVDSAVDGPFGSNLKIEHYVKEPGVRVVRLQNIANGYFDESDRAYISTSHAQYLKRHEVVAGDLLVASMGDDNHLIARACLYPDHLQAGIVKADCFRLRLLEHMADHGFVMHMLNCSSTRDDIDKFAQGVTRNRVNLGNLQKVRLRVPPVAEQQIIAEILFALDQKIETEANTLMKLRVVKAGLMQDLLTGKVHVGAGEDVLFDIACSQHTTESVDDAL